MSQKSYQIVISYQFKTYTHTGREKEIYGRKRKALLLLNIFKGHPHHKTFNRDFDNSLLTF